MSHLVVRTGRFSVRVHRRTALVAALLLVLALAVALYSLTLPGAGITTAEAFDALLGGDGFAGTVVLQWRLPRIVAALLVGAALAMSGAIFQSLTRNPLGSPDVIGFNTGAYTGALVVMLSGITGYAALSAGALVGGLLTAAAVYLLSLRTGAAGMRMIVVGLGISAMLAAVNRWLISAADLELSLAAASWGAGSLNGLRWGQVVPASAVLLVLLALSAGVCRRMDALDLGDDAASGLGVGLVRSRLLLLTIGVALTAASTALAGPISFVALAAPHIARRLSASGRVSFAPVAAVGALVLVVADLVAQRLFAPTQLPVGVITAAVGGVYLITLLAKESRR